MSPVTAPSGPGVAGAIQGGTAGYRVRIAISRPCPGAVFLLAALQALFGGGEGEHAWVPRILNETALYKRLGDSKPSEAESLHTNSGGISM